MRKIDAYLSRKAQAEWPTALVWKEEPSSATIPVNGNGNGDAGERFILERDGHDAIILGHQFKEARAGLETLLASARAKKAVKDAAPNVTPNDT
jgi:hypothetical protein